MSGQSAIEWTDATWNAIVGCSVVSPGCTNCYAMKLAPRLQATQHHYSGTVRNSNGGPVWTGNVARAHDGILMAPLHWKKPRRVFVNSMGDLFHESIPDEWIDKVFAVMALCPQHTFQVLTKRAERMRAYINGFESRHSPDGNTHLSPRTVLTVAAVRAGFDLPFEGLQRLATAKWPLPKVWLGVSAERQQEADERIPLLLQTPAAVRFVSCEPLLGRIDLDAIPVTVAPGFFGSAVRWHHRGKCHEDDGIKYPTIDWVIAGGESGRGARPMHPDWVRSLRDQCTMWGVSYFFKQWGEWAPQIGAVDGWSLGDNLEISRFDHREWEDGQWGEVFRPMWCDFQDGNYDEAQCVSRIGKKAAGRLLDGVEYSQFPGALR